MPALSQAAFLYNNDYFGDRELSLSADRKGNR
jgi:hypothetical protein